MAGSHRRARETVGWTVPARPRLPVFAFAAALLCAHLAAQSPEVPTPLTFDAALAWAAAHNLSVESARRGRAVREANIRTATQRPNPELGGEATRDTPHQALTIGIPLEFGNQRRRRIEVARAELGLADVDVTVSLGTVRRQLREQFYGLLAADEDVRLAASILDLANRLHDATQLRFEAGAVPRLEVLQTTLGVSRAEADLESARANRVSAQALLNGVLSLPPDRALVLAGSFDEHSATPTLEAAVAAAATTNVDLVSLDLQMAIEGRRLELLKAQRLPVPVLTAGALFHAPGEFSVAPTASFSVGLPLFSRNQGEIASSIANTSQLRSAREAARRRVENAVWAAHTRVTAARRRVETFARRLSPTATELADLSEESYRAGRSSVLGVLDSQRSLRDISRDALQASLDLQRSLAELEELIGAPLP